MKRDFDRRNNTQNTVTPNIKSKIIPQEDNNPYDFCQFERKSPPPPPPPPPQSAEDKHREYMKQLINDYQNAIVVVRELRSEFIRIGLNPDMYNPPK
jgi:hypothetical protein